MLPEIAAFGGGRLPPRAAQKHARTCKKLPVASFCASETAETGRIANGREQGDHVSRRQESYKGGKAAGNVPQSGENCCGRQKKAAERQKNLILFVRICCFGCADSRFGKTRSSFLEGFNFVREKPPLRRAESRFGKPRNSRQGSTGCYFLRRAKSNIKSTRDSVLRPAIQSSIEVDFSRVFQRHKPNPVFRTKRRRKGFESVRRSGVTA